jgi:hypothetical protein
MKQTIAVCFLLLWSSPVTTVFADSSEGQQNTHVLSADGKWGAGAFVTYQTGDFGTQKTTHTVYVPFTLTRYFKAGDVSWTIPYIYQKSPPGIIAKNGRPFQTNPQKIGDIRTGEGVGDMILTGSYDLLEEEQYLFNTSVFGKIKFPTADEDEGLGTGEFDEGFGVDVSKSLNDQWRLLAGMAYTFIGDPEGIDLDNEFAFDIGVGYQMAEPTLVTFVYEEKTALLDGHSSPRDLVLGVQHKMEEDIRLLGDFSVGLSNGSPDVGMTMGVDVRF